MVMVGQSPGILEAVRLIARIARFDVPALIEGETGTGKELAARQIHYHSVRRDRPFIPLNCGTLPDTLVENELFGHRRGAYTDARDDSVGVVALADKGTLFLDEIDTLSPRAQVALLRFLQDRHYRPLGADSDQVADVRIIAASNQDLEALSRKGQFRSDLLFRVKIMFVDLPPLRARAGDARLLAEHFLAECARRYREPPKRLHASTVRWIDAYGWPGNVRELENFIHREFLMADGPELVYPRESRSPGRVSPHDGSPVATLSHDGSPVATLPYKAARAAALSDFDRTFLTQLLARTSGNVTRAAREAGKERRALGRLLKKYGIEPGDFRQPG
jgi:DNA-binding NtrC family response regulator